MDKGLYSACFLTTIGMNRKNVKEDNHSTKLRLLMCEQEVMSA